MTRPLRCACLVSLLLAGCGGAPPAGAADDPPPVDGRLVIAAPGAPATTIAQADCRSGERETFFGIDVLGPGGALALRLVQDPLGDQALRVQQGSRRWVLRPSDCKTFEMALVRTRDRVNSIWDMNGSLNVLCTTRDGLRVEGRLTLRSCH